MHATLFTVAGAALALSVAAFRGGQPQAPKPVEQVDQAAADRAQDTRRLLLDVLGNGGAEARREVVADMLARIEPKNLELSPAEVNRVLELGRQDAQAGGQLGSAVYEAQPVPQELAGLKADWSLKNAPVSDAFAFLGKAANLPVNVRWTLLTPETGLEPGKPTITMQAKGAGVAAFLRTLNETVGAKGEASVDVRVSDGELEVATRGYFDRRERELVSYDLSGIIGSRMTTYSERRDTVVQELTKVIEQFVSPDDWRDNGGELAEMTVVGDRLFVNAPARFHPQIRWILGQLPAGKAEAGPRPAMGPVMIGRYPLKYTQAAEVYSVLRHMTSISSIDFSECATDAATNSLLIQGSAAEQERVKIAIECLDRPAEKRAELHGVTEKDAAAAVVGATAESGAVFLSGHVVRPGAYAVANGELTVRRLLAASGGLRADATVVEVSDTKDGKSVLVHRFEAAELRQADGPDPVLEKGQMVCVR